MISPTSLLFLIPSILLGAFGSIFLKKGTKALPRLSKMLALGFFLYGSSSLFYMVALRFGELSLIYPLSSLNYLFVAFLSVRMLKENMSSRKWLGIIFIIFGAFFIIQ